MHSLPIFLRLSGQPVILVGDGDMAAAKRRLLERAGAVIVGEDAEARIALVAVDDGADAITARLKERGLLVNVADRPDLCDFTLPSLLERDPVVIAIGTGGASAGLAKALRQRLELLLPASLGSLAAALGAARGAIRQRWPDAATRRRAIDAALDAGGPLDVLGGADGSHVQDWLAGEARAVATGLKTIHVASADPDDLTIAQSRWLGQADLIVHTASTPTAILARARADAARMAGGDLPDPLPPGLNVQIIHGQSG